MERDQILAALNWRYAVKKFDPAKRIPEPDWNVIAESLRLSASSYGLQPWKFLIVDSPEIRKQLRPHSWDQSQIEDCSHLVVLAHLKHMSEPYIRRYTERIAKVRGVAFEQVRPFYDAIVKSVIRDEYEASGELANWTARQVYLAMGTALTTASLLRVDACPMEGLDPLKYDEILGLKDTDYKTVAVLAFGYRAADDTHQNLRKVRFELNEVFVNVGKN